MTGAGQNGGMLAEGPIIYGTSLNAIAFWYQFGFASGWDDLLADMAMLAKAAPALTDPTAALQFSIPANGGCFCGLRAIDPETKNGSPISVRSRRATTSRQSTANQPLATVHAQRDHPYRPRSARISYSPAALAFAITRCANARARARSSASLDTAPLSETTTT
jgi:hypothetical protein